MNPLDDYPQIRKLLYRIQWAVNGIMLLAGGYFAAADTALDDLPKWYVLALALLPIAWTYFGLTASANVPDSED